MSSATYFLRKHRELLDEPKPVVYCNPELPGWKPVPGTVVESEFDRQRRASRLRTIALLQAASRTAVCLAGVAGICSAVHAIVLL